MTPDPTLSRRQLLRSAGIAVAGTVAAGEATAKAGKRPNFGGWLSGVDGGFKDARGQDHVTVKVGAKGNGGYWAFSPAGLWVDSGTKVTWKWTGKGNQHTVTAKDGSFDSKLHGEKGYTFEQTFDSGGITKYYCKPHRPLGMKGGVAVGGDVPTGSSGGSGDKKSAGSGSGESGGSGGGLPGNQIGLAFVGLAGGITGIGSLSVLGAEVYEHLEIEWK